jgi:hypothetical protein
MRRTRAWWLLAVLGVVTAVSAGCVTTGQHPEICPEPPPNAFDLPAGCRNGVYFFLVGDFHPCHDLEQLRGKLLEAGYIKVYCGNRIHLWHFASELKKVHEANPEARFVIVGQGAAAPAARELASRASQVGAPLDLFVYLDEVKEPSPVPAQQVIAIHGENDADSTGTDAEYAIPGVGYKGAAGHVQTLKILLEYLNPIALRVPLLDHDSPGVLPPLPSDPASPGKLPPPLPVDPASPGKLPAPSPVDPVSTSRDEWGLKPDGKDIAPCGCLPTQLAPGAVPASMRVPARP